MGGWIGPYFRGGPAIPLGQHPFQSNNSPGVNIQLGMRSRLTCGPNDFLFYDLGGSFMSVRGLRTEPTGGSIQNTVTGAEIVPSAVYNSHLSNVRRASGDLALGGYFHPLKVFGVPSRYVRGVVRGGGRWGSAFGQFDDSLTPEAAAAVTAISISGQTSRINSNYSKTSSFVGLFVAGGIDFIVTEPDPNLATRPFVTFGADVEYSHDWITFKRFSNNPLDAVSIMAHGTLIF